MSGRIRTIKPEVLEDAVSVSLSDAAWRLWVSSWLLADDHGCLRAHDAYLAANVWQDTSRQVAEVRRELCEVGLWTVYTVRGQLYACVTGWSKHQRVDNAGKRRVPGPDEGEPPPTDPPATSKQVVTPSLSEVRGESPTNAESRGDSPSRAGARSPAAGPPTPTPTPTTDPTEVPPARAPGAVDRLFLSYLDVRKRHGKRPTKLKPTERRRAEILLRSGYSEEDLVLACEGLFTSPHHLGQNDRDTQYLEFFHALSERAVDGLIDRGRKARRAATVRAVPAPDPGPPAQPTPELLAKLDSLLNPPDPLAELTARVATDTLESRTGLTVAEAMSRHGTGVRKAFPDPSGGLGAPPPPSARPGSNGTAEVPDSKEEVS